MADPVRRRARATRGPRWDPLTVGIDAHGNSLYHDVQTAAQEKLKELYARL